MKRFNKILVGVDLSDGDRMVSNELSPTTAEAVERALWLAKLNSAQLQFFYSLDVGSQAERLIRENQSTEKTVFDKAEQVLEELVAKAKRMDIRAERVVTYGKSWLGLIHHVLRENNDLVIVGSKQHGAVERLFIGTTGMKLLRKCPCPVWVTHPPKVGSKGAVLVAHDLTEVGDLGLELGASMAEIHQAPLHVVHAIETVEITAAEPLVALPTADEEVQQEAIKYITDQLMPYQHESPPQIHVEHGAAASIIEEQIKQYDIDLLVMGTIARSGIEGLLFGNTAERLLPIVDSSVLAIKPDYFRCPISPE